MSKESEQQYIIYTILKTQIEFGYYRYLEKLPNMEDACVLLMVSVDTVHSAYSRLKREKLITMSQNTGSVVTVNYSEQEIEQHIQVYFAARKTMILDACRSLPLLYGDINVLAWKYIAKEHLNSLVNLAETWSSNIVHLILHCLMRLFDSFGNDLLLRLTRKMYLFYMAPFYSLPDYPLYIDMTTERLNDRVNNHFEHKWEALQVNSYHYAMKLSSALENFYSTRINISIPEEQIPFTWSSYKKASQICYSLGLEFISDIIRNRYLRGSLLPSLESLAKLKGVSVSTIRRTLALLNKIGVTKSINGVGTRVLMIEEIGENCDFSSPAAQNRLLDFAHSFQILALSCRKVAEATVAFADDGIIHSWIAQLELFRDQKNAGLSTPLSIEFIASYAPYQVLRVVYGELYSQFLWGYPLLSKFDVLGLTNALYASYLDSMIHALEHSDAPGFALQLSDFMGHQLRSIAKLLIDEGISRAKTILDYLDGE